MGGQSFTIGSNGPSECIRLLIDGKHQRVYLSHIEKIADLLGNHGSGPLPTPTCRIRELGYLVETAEMDPVVVPEISEAGYAEPLSLGERIIAIKAKLQPSTLQLPVSKGVDPLAYDTDEEYHAAVQAASAPLSLR
jgi:hypothetical protein